MPDRLCATVHIALRCVGSWCRSRSASTEAHAVLRGVLSDDAAHDVLQAAARIGHGRAARVEVTRSCGESLAGLRPPRAARLTGSRSCSPATGRSRSMGPTHLGEIAAPRGAGHALAYSPERH